MAKTTGASMATAATLESMPRRMMCVPTIMVRMACHQLMPTTQAWMWSASHWARPDWVMAVVMVMAPPSSRKVPQMVFSCTDFQEQGMRPGAKSTSMPSRPMTPRGWWCSSAMKLPLPVMNMMPARAKMPSSTFSGMVMGPRSSYFFCRASTPPAICTLRVPKCQRIQACVRANMPR